MSFVLNKAKEGYDNRLALFNVPPVETGIVDIYYKDFRPTGQLSKGATLEFDVNNTSSDYIIPSDISLLLTLQLLDDKNKPITSANEVAFVNFPASSIFRQQDLSIQQQIITSSVGSNHPYKCMFDVLLNQGRNDQLSWMALGGFEKDTAGSMDDFQAKDTGNTGLSNRYNKTKDGKKVIYKTKLFSDICQQERLLVNGLPINVKLYPSTDQFSLLYKTQPSTSEASKSYSVNIEDATLIVPFAKINAGMLMAQAELMKREMALYPFTRSEIKGYNIPKGSYSWTMDNLFQDSIPKRMVLAFVESSAYSGHEQMNPFDFKTFDVSYIDFQVDGQTSGAQILQPDYTNGNYVTAFSRLFECMPPDQKEPPNISYYDYANGYSMYLFNLETSKDSLYSNPLKRGQTRLTVKFKKALTEPVTALVYGSFEALMKVDQARNVLVVT